MQKAYPMYDEDWSTRVDAIRAYLSENARNLQLVGRNGMHKYNNQDHSMMTALYAARNICGANYDLWAVNTEPEYQEEKREPGRGDPTRASKGFRSERNRLNCIQRWLGNCFVCGSH
jgi:Protoporphyrinogen oxidase